MLNSFKNGIKKGLRRAQPLFNLKSNTMKNSAKIVISYHNHAYFNKKLQWKRITS